MKYLLILLAFVSVSAYGQSIGYWRYDTVKLQKIGGNSELVILNGSRSLIGAGMYNMGNGRTAFVNQVGDSPVLPPEFVKSGFLWYDSTGADSGLYVYHRPYWVKVGQAYTAGNAMTLTGSAFDWGGTMTASTTIAQGLFPLNFTTGGAMGTNLTPFKISGTPASFTSNPYHLVDINLTGALAGISKQPIALYINNALTHPSGSNVGARIKTTGAANGINMALIIEDSAYVNIGTGRGVNPVEYFNSRLVVRTDGLTDDPPEQAGLVIVNYESATSVLPKQFSPPLSFAGFIYDTTGVDSSQNIYYDIYMEPHQGPTRGEGWLKIDSYRDGLETGTPLVLGMVGQIGVNDGDFGTAGQILSSGGADGSATWINTSSITPGLQSVMTAGNQLTSSAYNNTDLNSGTWQIGEAASLGAGKGLIVDMANDAISMMGSGGAQYMQVRTGGITEGQVVLQNVLSGALKGLKIWAGDSTIIGMLGTGGYDKVRMKIARDSIFIKNLPSIGAAAQSNVMIIDSINGQIRMMPQSAFGGSSVTWNSITNPTGTQTLSFDDAELNDWTNGSNTETFHTYTSNSQTTGTTLKLQSSSTTTGKMVDITMTGTAADNGQVGLNVNLSGANASASKATYAGRFTNAHTGTTPLNWNVYTDAGVAGFGTPSAVDANAAVIIRQPNDGAASRGLRILSNNELAGAYYGYGKIIYSGQYQIEGDGGLQLMGNASAVYYNMTSTGLTNIGSSATATSTLNVAGSLGTAYRAITALRTLDATDNVIEVTANTFTVTLPTAVGITGRIYTITNSGSGVVTLATTSSQTFVNVTLTPTTLTLNQFNTVSVISNGANWLRTTNL